MIDLNIFNDISVAIYMKGKALPEKMMFSIPRGFMEMHILRILQTPHHGYEMIKRLEQECAYWKPSPGSVYPILRKLKKAGLITEKDKANKKIYTITSSGKERVKKFDSYRNEIKEKMIAFFRMMGEDANITDFGKGFELFEKIRKDPAKRRKAARLREEFHRKMTALAEE
jgi:DNA-binding PadR family transcriptional regulator